MYDAHLPMESLLQDLWVFEQQLSIGSPHSSLFPTGQPFHYSRVALQPTPQRHRIRRWLPYSWSPAFQEIVHNPVHPREQRHIRSLSKKLGQESPRLSAQTFGLR